MLTATARGTFAALALFLSLSLFAQTQPWDGAPFTADPKALVAAAAKVEADDFAMVDLLDEAEFAIDEDGATRVTTRHISYVVSEAGVEYASEVRAPWQPWFYERPLVEARVVTADGTVHRLDKSALVEVPADEEGDIFSDGRVLRAPLPAVAVGSVIEYVIVQQGKGPIRGAGTSVDYWFGGLVPVERTRVVLDAPLSFQPRVVNRTGVEPRVEEKNGRRRTTYEAGRIDGQREWEQYLPYDVPVFGSVLSFSTGKSWQHIAASYSAIVDQQIADSDLQKLVRGAVGNATDRKEIVDRLLAAIQKDVRYAGVEIGEGSIVPRKPRQVLSNRYGDCKDKAALLVAMLRVAGLPAHVALLRASDDLDVQPELPGLDSFNHAIAVVEGEPAIWVDPTDVFARAGELPLLDQGRMALIAKPETTTLTRTPETPSTANVYRERRTYLLPEEGKARVTEVTEATATASASLRRWISGLDAKTLREQLESYAESSYLAKVSRHETTAPADLITPVRLTLEMTESRTGIVEGGEASVAINVGALPQEIPDVLRDWEEPEAGADPEDAPKPRTRDFLLPAPGVREWVYRIVPPAGYTPRTLPPSETKKLGTMTFSQELRAEPDQSVVATFRFDMGKRRLTAAEFEQTRVELTKFVTDNVLYIGFDQTGQVKLNAGDVRGALDEFRRLIALHPKEAQHHIELARALLTAGLGEAAREEIRRAIALEPKNALAHETLGSILLHDTLGRPYRKGFDLKGAVAALRKAKELKPDDAEIRTALVSALMHGEDGHRFSRGAALDEAAKEIEAAVKDLGDEGKPLLPDLGVIYAHRGRFADMRTLAPTIEEAQQRDMIRIAAAAALDGTDAAVRELGAFDQQTRRTYASGVAQLLLQVRLYPQAAALIRYSSQGTATAADQQQRAAMLDKMKRFEDLPADHGPRGVAVTMLAALVAKDRELMKTIVPAELLDADFDEFQKLDLRAPDGMTPEVFRDVMVSVFEIQQEGDDATGYRLRLRAPGGTPGTDELALYLRKENGRWMIRGLSPRGETLTGHTILTMAANGEMEAARRWLNWTREDAQAGSSDDPLAGDPFTLLWSKSKASATDEEVRVAAASIATDKHGGEKSEAILLEARERAQSDLAKAAVDLALLRIYADRKDRKLALAVTERLLAAQPDSQTAFTKRVELLLQNGSIADAKTLAAQRMERLPGDVAAVRALALAATYEGDYAAAQKHALKIVEELRPQGSDYGRSAWLALFTGKDLDRAIEHARESQKRAGGTRGEETPAALAALYADSGKSVEARTALLASLDESHRGTLSNNDWYVLGRIAENYGVEDFALMSYRKVQKQDGAATVSELARRRLEGLTRKKGR